MVYRDPETGQFVSGTDGASRDYRDYEFQHIRTEWNVDAADLPGAFPIVEEDIHVVDMEDLLHRDERAELVGVFLHALQAVIPGTTTAEASIRAEFELGIGQGSKLLENNDRDDYRGSAGESGVANISTWANDDPDVLYHAGWWAEGGFGDSTNGMGAGPDQPVLQETTHFPRDFGACPSLDERDEISESWKVTNPTGADVSDSEIGLLAAYSLVFAVEEEARY